MEKYELNLFFDFCGRFSRHFYDAIVNYMCRCVILAGMVGGGCLHVTWDVWDPTLAHEQMGGRTKS